MRVLYPGRIGTWSVGFCGRRKTGELGDKPSEQGENQQQTQPTYSAVWHWAGIESGPHCWEASALTTALIPAPEVDLLTELVRTRTQERGC